MLRKIGAAWGLVSLLAMAFAAATEASPVRIDPEFGDGGIARTSLPPSYRVTAFEAVAAGAEGGVVATTGSGDTVGYDASGHPDEGETAGAAGSPVEVATADGGRVVVGASSGSIGWGVEDPEGRVTRYAADGSLVTSFGEGGTVKLNFFPEALATLPSGKVLVAGEGVQIPGDVKSPPTAQVIVARLDADGSLDPSFGGGSGSVGLGAAFGINAQKALALRAREGGGAEVVISAALVGIDPAGDLDPGFGEGGEVATLGHVVSAESVGQGVLVAGGKRVRRVAENEEPLQEEAPSKEEFYVARYRTDGKLDPGFGNGDGIATLRPRGEVRARSVAFEADGSIVIGGSVTPPTPGCPFDYFCDNTPTIVRFTSAGRPDRGFAHRGVLRIGSLAARSGGESLGGTLALAPRPGGGFFAAGESAQAGWVAAINADGTLDGRFGEAGIARRVESEAAISSPAAVGVDRRGRIYVAAETSSGSFGNAAVIRYLPDGDIDRSYGEEGEAFVAAGPKAIAVAPDGTAFTVTHESGPIPTLTKVMPSGRLDPRFGKRGTAYFPFRPHAYEPAEIVRLPGGEVLVTGNLTVGETERPTLVRFLPSGKVDGRFGKDGVDELRIGRHRRWFARMAVPTGGGGLLLGGLAEPSSRHRHGPDTAAVVRLGEDGKIDRSFGHRGSVLFAPGGISVVDELVPRGGRIFTLTYTTRPGHDDYRLYAFSTDGRSDRRFGRDGGIQVASPSHGMGTERRSEPDLGMFLRDGRILVALSGSVLSYSASGHLERARSGVFSELLSRRLTDDVCPWGPAAALDGDDIVVTWAGTAPEATQSSGSAGVNLRRLLVR